MLNELFEILPEYSDFMPREIQNSAIRIIHKLPNMPEDLKKWTIQQIVGYNTVLTAEQRKEFFEKFIVRLV